CLCRLRHSPRSWSVGRKSQRFLLCWPRPSGPCCPAIADRNQAGRTQHTVQREQPSLGSKESIRRNAIADDANSAAPFAPDKRLPFGIGDKVGATVTNRARSDSLAHEVGRRLRGTNRKQRSRECERR